MKLSETPFALKLAKAPKVSIAASAEAAERLLSDRRGEFAAQIVQRVDEIEEIVAARTAGAEFRIAFNASEIAGAAGLLGQHDVARIASWLAQLGDEMAEGGWNWQAVDVFCRALRLATRSVDEIDPKQMQMLLAHLDAVRAAMKERTEKRAARGLGPAIATGD